PFPPRSRLARAAGRLGLVRQGDVLSSGDRSPQGLLPDRGPGRLASGAGEADREAPDPGPRAGGQLAGAPVLLDVPADDPQSAALDPSHRRRRTLDAVKRLLLRESQVQPLLVVFEDLHWIDSETQALLNALVESLPATRVLLLVNYRPEYSHPWGGRTYYTQLRLDALPPDTAAELLGALLGPDPGLDPLKRMLTART